MSSGASIVFNDPRRFGYMKVIARKGLEDEPLLRGLGPEPLGNEFDANMLARSCASKKTSLKAALLDQRVVAGLGNIYVCEALFRAHLSPRRLAATLADKKGEPDRSRQAAGRGDSRGAQPGHQGRRLVAAGSPPDLGRTRLFPALVSGLRPRRREMPDRGMRRDRAAIHPERTIDLLVPEVPEMKLPTLRRQARHSIARSQRVARMRARPFAFAEDERGKSLAHGVRRTAAAVASIDWPAEAFSRAGPPAQHILMVVAHRDNGAA